MDNYYGSICPYCRQLITQGQAIKICPDCGAAHHENCWIQNGGCTTYGCRSQHSVISGTAYSNSNVYTGTGVYDTQNTAPGPNAYVVSNTYTGVGVYDTPPVSEAPSVDAPSNAYVAPSAPAPSNAYTAPSAPAPSNAYIAPSAPAPSNAYTAPSAPAPSNAYVAPSAAAPSNAYSAPSANASISRAATAGQPKMSNASNASSPASASSASKAPGTFCRNCGAAMAAGQGFCSKCGAKVVKEPPKNVCRNCGAELMPGQGFCPKCGQKAGTGVSPELSSAVSQYNKNIEETKKKSSNKVFIIVGGVILLIILIAVLSNSSIGGPNFKKIYDKYCDSYWAEVGSDGSYLTIDTNPLDIDDYIDFDAWHAIEDINDYLGLPDSLTEDMNSTRALDGRQTESFDKVNVSWSYHPDRGLVVTYKKN